jgi:hypothetical protein
MKIMSKNLYFNAHLSDRLKSRNCFLEAKLFYIVNSLTIYRQLIA